MKPKGLSKIVRFIEVSGLSMCPLLKFHYIWVMLQSDTLPIAAKYSAKRLIYRQRCLFDHTCIYFRYIMISRQSMSCIWYASVVIAVYHYALLSLNHFRQRSRKPKRLKSHISVKKKKQSKLSLMFMEKSQFISYFSAFLCGLIHILVWQ